MTLKFIIWSLLAIQRRDVQKLFPKCEGPHVDPHIEYTVSHVDPHNIVMVCNCGTALHFTSLCEVGVLPRLDNSANWGKKLKCACNEMCRCVNKLANRGGILNVCTENNSGVHTHSCKL